MVQVEEEQMAKAKKTKAAPVSGGAESTRKHYAKKRAEGWVRLGYWVPGSLKEEIGAYVAKKLKAHAKAA